MIVYEIPQSLIDSVADEPEIAMGHKEIVIIAAGQRIKGYLVCGAYFVPHQKAEGTMFRAASLAESPIQLIDTREPEIQPLDRLLISSRDVRIQNVPHLSNLAQALSKTAQTSSGTPPFVTKTKTGETFYRVSAFRNDKNIGSKGEVAPQTYSTTDTDIKEVPSGLAAVGRYALPSRLPAVHVFLIEPPKDTDVAYGTVTPANGLAGGGVEAYFPNGCAANSAKHWRTISMK